ncbi:MAG: FG-GAP repeat protein, partial [Candidatus Cloacimonetes bacterium]|nr:FG-GAP repeat protein [Candidatus Cloacimonadota bacterium]
MKKLLNILVFTLFTSVVLFADWGNEEKVLASDGVAEDKFGNSISISGDYAIIGAVGDDDNGNYSGAAYMFHYNGSNWVQQTKLTPSDATANDHFGISVSMFGDYAVIGNVYDDDNGANSGSAYIFHYDGSNWVQQAKLTASDGADGDHFGRVVSISGDYAIIGAYADDNDNGNFAGSAYIFYYDGSSWSQQAKLTASDGETYDLFGVSVSISGDYVVIGTYCDDGNLTEAGAIYFFHYDGSIWVQQAKFFASDAEAHDLFGHSVSISGDYAIIGSGGDDDNGNFSGSAYIFHYDGSSWSQQTKLTASDSGGGDYFGGCVSISGDYVIIGASDDDDIDYFAGSAYIFHYDGSSWSQQTKLTASDGADGDHFGHSVSISGNQAVIGAYMDDDNGDYSGSAYFYENSSVAVLPSSFD